MKKITKKIASLVLALAMALTLMPAIGITAKAGSATSLMFIGGSYRVSIGTTGRIEYTLTPEDADDITWESSDSNVVTVDQSGNYKAEKAGTATITAHNADNSVSDSCSIEVLSDKKPTSISLSETESTMAVGQTKKLTATVTPEDAPISWGTNDPDVAWVEPDGTIHASKEGTATITASGFNDSNICASCTLTVTAAVPVDSITLDNPSLTLYLDDETANTGSLTATVSPADTTYDDLYWYIGDGLTCTNGIQNNDSTKSKTCEFKANAVGSYFVSVRCGMKTAGCSVNVKLKNKVEGTCGASTADDVKWAYDDSQNTLTISGNGAMADFDSEGAPWYQYRNSIATIKIEDGITKIGANAFAGCISLQTITFPTSVTSIGDKAFYNCSYLSKVEFKGICKTIGSETFKGTGRNMYGSSGSVALTLPEGWPESDKPDSTGAWHGGYFKIQTAGNTISDIEITVDASKIPFTNEGDAIPAYGSQDGSEMPFTLPTGLKYSESTYMGTTYRSYGLVYVDKDGNPGQCTGDTKAESDCTYYYQLVLLASDGYVLNDTVTVNNGKDDRFHVNYCYPTYGVVSIMYYLGTLDDVKELKGVQSYEKIATTPGTITDITTSSATKAQNTLGVAIKNSDALATLLGLDDTVKAQGVNVWLAAKDVSTTVSAADKEKIDSVKSDYTIGTYMDLSLLKKVGTGDASAVTDLNGNLQVSISVPESLRKDGRTYEIIRIHNGEATVIPGTYDSATGTFTFETNGFSTYALAYKDGESGNDLGAYFSYLASLSKTDAANGTAVATAPKTGDSASWLFWIVLALAALAGAGSVMVYRRRR